VNSHSAGEGPSAARETPLPLAGVRVLDLSTLVPGPLATLILADAGATVIKIERPGTGDELRLSEPRLAGGSVVYGMLNRGKRAYAVDLKDPGQRERVLKLAGSCDVVVEQFRPGVADRLGLGYDAVRAANPGVVYCSITGYGQTGADAGRVGHDLSYLAESGLLGLVTDADGRPSPPFTVLADITGGAYPAVMNILLALRAREVTGEGTHIDISMSGNLRTLAYRYLAAYQAPAGQGRSPRPNGEHLTGGNPRYTVYRTSDGRYVAVAAVEDRFWRRLARLIGLEERFVDDRGQEEVVGEAVARCFEARSAEDWHAILAAEEVCASVVATFDEAVAAGRLLVDAGDRLSGPGFDVAALPTPVADQFRVPPGRRGYPTLGELPGGQAEEW
jgi:alpha-methylacyl-CoA racemase